MTERLGDAPIQEQYRDLMNVVAGSLDAVFNGGAKGDDRETGFVLLVFPFGHAAGGRCNFISNLRETIRSTPELSARGLAGALADRLRTTGLCAQGAPVMTSNTREALAAELEGIASLLGRNQLTQRGTASRKIRQAAAALRAPVSVSPSPSADREALFEAIRSNVFATVYENVGGISDAVDAILALSPARSAGNQSGASVEPSTLAASVMTTDAASRRGEPDYDICGYRDSSDTYSVAVTERGVLEACKNYLQPKAKWKDGANYFMENEESRLLAKVDAALRRTVAETATVPVEHMTMEVIDAAFERWRKTLTVVDRPSNQQIFSEGYVAGWTGKETQIASPAAPSPAVRKLEWVERIGVAGTFDASTSIGHFIATITDDNLGMWFIVGQTTSNYTAPDMNLIKAAAQAEYEARIRAALAQPATAEETAPGFVKFVQEP